MYVHLQTSDGQVFASDSVTIAESGLTPVEWDEGIAQLEDVLNQVGGDCTYLSLTIGGRDRIFNPNHVVWVEIVH